MCNVLTSLPWTQQFERENDTKVIPEATYKMSTSEMPSATMADVCDVLDVPMYTNVSVTGCQPTKQILFFKTVTRVP